MNSSHCVILLIEDDPDDVFLFKRAVAHSTIICEVHDVATLQDAEDYLCGSGTYADRKEYPFPDIIITDLAFRGGSGLEFLSWLEEHPEFGRIPVLCVSGTEDPAKLEQARRFGVKCLAKTGLFENAMSVVQELLSHSVPGGRS
jgi:CheY-like chemotaxis protein